MALGWIGSTTAFGDVVKKPYTRCGPGIGFDLVPRSSLNSVQMPAKANRGRFSLSANHTTSFFLVSGFGSGVSRKTICGDQASVLRFHPMTRVLVFPEIAYLSHVVALPLNSPPNLLANTDYPSLPLAPSARCVARRDRKSPADDQQIAPAV
jgi:hypothetical protein